jgi:N-acetylneuraminic acid mutarotase
MKSKKTIITLKTNLIILFLLVLFIASSVKITAQTPSARKEHRMVYNSESDRTILYGGFTSAGDPNSWVFDTWSYDFNANIWTKLITEGEPYSCVSLSLAYDSESNVIILYGGIRKDHVGSNQTWIFDYNENNWVNAEPSICPDYRHAQKTVYDSESDVVILFGGRSHEDHNPYGVMINYNDTWSYDYNSNSWTNMTSTLNPIGRFGHAMTYDSESDRVIIFGGADFLNEIFVTGDLPYLDETWAYDYNTNTWENLTTTEGPEARIESSMVYDSESDRCILFGGWHHMYENKYGDETWAYDYNTNTWVQMDLEGTGPWRYDPQMAYDSESDRIIMFGGTPETSIFDDTDETWSYDYNTDTWELMEKTNGTSFSLSSLLISLNFFVILLLLKKRRKRKRRNTKNEK